MAESVIGMTIFKNWRILTRVAVPRQHIGVSAVGQPENTGRIGFASCGNRLIGDENPTHKLGLASCSEGSERPTVSNGFKIWREEPYEIILHV
jgi:hypothetical protein